MHKKNNLKKKEETPKVVPTPPKKNKKVWKQKEEAPKSTTTPRKSHKMVWRPKKVQSSVSTSSGTNVPSSSKKWKGEKSRSLGFKRWARTEGKLVVIPYFLLNIIKLWNIHARIKTIKFTFHTFRIKHVLVWSMVSVQSYLHRLFKLSMELRLISLPWLNIKFDHCTRSC